MSIFSNGHPALDREAHRQAITRRALVKVRIAERWRANSEAPRLIFTSVRVQTYLFQTSLSKPYLSKTLRWRKALGNHGRKKPRNGAGGAALSAPCWERLALKTS
jgi:hypothetical protein